jgi:hypothetical protein
MTIALKRNYLQDNVFKKVKLNLTLAHKLHWPWRSNDCNSTQWFCLN